MGVTKLGLGFGLYFEWSVAFKVVMVSALYMCSRSQGFFGWTVHVLGPQDGRHFSPGFLHRFVSTFLAFSTSPCVGMFQRTTLQISFPCLYLFPSLYYPGLWFYYECSQLRRELFPCSEPRRQDPIVWELPQQVGRKLVQTRMCG